ncbi:UTP--glucose-1-phosphate uridylyltransferase GalU [Acuticoccus sp. I52.16.1]|uniref:UTP--glucose-1-phosphate uridylyltransferase GalU n=1 Tax=Acuticoccus sp. I52.16.1 TaxID=2928472 RepID=UPI001FD1520D|nr:UTP--glucose-1-phosphate uridylyltransferase GalU [Acuticoccus sp. I52.16.1]UOM36977.1 UTP--glucose-1-phosphate uridylyltransferase GalU [Acuticoccus sp. I52.16.1]
MQPVRKAVLPVAGLGTRFLPATKVMPKEMLTVVDKPVLQYVVDEAREAGIEQFIFVTGRGKGVIEDHFDTAFELEATLAERGKTGPLEQLRAELPAAGNVSFTRQQAPLGLGHAVWCARELVGDEPFALLLPDVIIKNQRGVMAQMMDVYNEHGTNVIAVEEVAPERTDQYGVVEISGSGDVFDVTGMVEKPKAGTAPSNLIITGRYILKPRIFDLLKTQEKGAGGEIQITDSMLTLMREDGFKGLRFQGTTYDCGSKIGFLSAQLAYGLDRPDLGPDLREVAKALLA